MSDRRSEYERLIAPIEDRMIRSVWRIVNDPDEAEDAFQEALLAIWRRWDALCRHPNPHALILRICVNSAYDALRRRARRSRRLDAGPILEEIPDPSLSAMQLVSIAEQRAQVLRAVGSLSRNQARAFLMHAIEEIPYDDIAAAMNCRESTVRKHVARARARLCRLLSHLAPPVREEEGSHA